MTDSTTGRSALDSFEIVTTSGILLWSKQYSPVSSNIVNSFISDVLIEDRVQPGSDGKWYKKDTYTLKWSKANDFGLIFIAVYQSLLQLTWIDELLESVKTLFTALYGDQLKNSNGSTIKCHFDEYFDTRLHELEKKAGGPARLPITPVPTVSAPAPDQSEWAPPPIPGLIKNPHRPSSPAVNGLSATTSPDNSRPVSPAPGKSAVLVGGKRRGGRRRGGKHSEDDSPAPSATKKKGKQLRRWDADGMTDDSEDVVLDYSAQNESDGDDTRRHVELVDQKEWGKKTSKGEFVLKDLGEEVDSILKQADQKQSGVAAAAGGAFGFFRNFVGGKVLSKEDVDKALAGMKDHLLKKNVAQEATIEICKNVEKSLIGQKTGSFQSIDSLVRSAVEASLRKILTPTNSLDLLREIYAKRNGPGKRPYVISIVGVNGVGKSTNLSKICFFLLQNKFKVLIAACDTFRSGAVEQLRVHARNLKELSEREGGVVELYEKGYGKDAANIAKDAVAYGEAQGYDVVLIDTAGRRHNDQRLMSSLEKFAKFALPDKIFMVGEALVGTDSVMQARNFNAAFGNARKLDGFIISKCDTVGDMIGTLISMVFATGIPVVFLGVGQNYQDLRTLNISWAVGLLMA